MRKAAHVDVEAVRCSAFASCKEAVQIGFDRADNEEDRALIRLQERAIPLQVELQAWMAQEFNRMSEPQMQAAAVANIIFSFLMNMEKNEDIPAPFMLAHINRLLGMSMANGHGTFHVTGAIPATEGGHA